MKDRDANPQRTTTMKTTTEKYTSFRETLGTPPTEKAQTTNTTAQPTKLSVQIEAIDGTHAALYLAKNKTNRKLKKTTVTAYAHDMRLGKWLLTHQGIAFDEGGTLIDGQHRLHAIIKSKRSVRMLVLRGVPCEQLGATTMDAVDRGVTRSVADQLGLHGFNESNLLAGATSVVAQICGGEQVRVRKLTVPQTLAVLELYKDSLRHVIDKRSRMHGLKSALVLGAVAFARGGCGGEVDEFYHQLVSGENLRADMPALTMRNWLFDTTSISCGGSKRWQQWEMILHAIHCHIKREPLVKMTWNREGVSFFRSKQLEKIVQVVALFKAEED